LRVTTALAIAQGAFGRVALLDMNTPLVGHAHPHCHILLKASGADQQFVVGTAHIPMTDDSAALVNAWEHHHYTPVDPSARTVFLALYLTPEWLAQLERSFAECDHPGFFARPGIAITPAARALRGRLVSLLSDEHRQPRTISEAIFALAAEIIHGGAQWRELGLGARSPRLRDFRLRRAVRIMTASEGRTDLDVVAHEVGLSRPRFNQLFRLCMGVSPGVYHATLQLERAVAALGGERLPVNLVSDALGFSAQSNFTRFFQQHAGVAPSEFRRVAQAVES
jgi:AraC-like DNA-binding protein